MSNTDASNDDVVAALVEFIMNEPGMTEGLLRVHVPTSCGECRDCSGQLRRKSWPCVFHLCVQKAALRVRQAEHQEHMQPQPARRHNLTEKKKGSPP